MHLVCCLLENCVFGVISQEVYFILRGAVRSRALHKITEVFLFLFAGLKQLTVHIFWIRFHKQ